MNLFTRFSRLALLLIAVSWLASTQAKAAGFLYALNDNPAGNRIYGFAVDETSGALTPLANFPVVTGFNGANLTSVQMLTIDRANKRLYAINRGSNNISAYSIDPVTGALAPLPFSPIAGIANQRTVEVHPSGSPLIVGGDLIASFVITTTAAQPAAGSPYSPGANVSPSGSTLSRDGNFYYTGGNLGNFFAGFAVDAVSGVLTNLPGSPFDSGNQTPNPTATDQTGRLFVINSRQALTRVYTTANGVPAQIPGSPFANGLTSFLSKGAVHPNGNFFMLADRTNNRVGVYQISGSGADTILTQIPGSPFAAGGTLTLTFAFNRMGNLLFAVNGSSRNFSIFNVDSQTGALSNRVVQPPDSLGTAGNIYGAAYANFDPNQAPRTAFDFDGDARADIATFRQAEGNWYYLRSGSQNSFVAVKWGSPADLIQPADYDADGKSDIAVWRDEPGNPDRANFYILNSRDNTVRIEQFGRTGDVPIAGDWDGDGRADLAVYRAGSPENPQSRFFYRPSGTTGTDFLAIEWGLNGDKPVAGDFDRDGKQDAAVFRPSNGVWYILQSSTSAARYEQFGIASDKLVPADYDADAQTDVAVFRDGVWYIRESSTNQLRYRYFGISTDAPVPADYDGDARADAAVYRGGVWYLQQTTSGFATVQFGTNDDEPVPSAYLP